MQGMWGPGYSKIVSFGGSLRKRCWKAHTWVLPSSGTVLSTVFSSLPRRSCSSPVASLFHYSVTSKRPLWTSTFYKVKALPDAELNCLWQSCHRQRWNSVWITDGRLAGHSSCFLCQQQYFYSFLGCLCQITVDFIRWCAICPQFKKYVWYRKQLKHLTVT